MLEKEKETFNVEFTTAFAGTPFINVVIEAEDEDEAKRAARNICRFGYISNVTKDAGVAAVTKSSHEWAYDSEYDVYGW